MLRILIDELGDGHNDLVLKIDTLPSFARFGDLYYMANFLNPDRKKTGEEAGNIGWEYLKYVRDKFAEPGESGTFIVFNIQDESIEGLLVSGAKGELVRVSYVVTEDIRGYEIDKNVLDRLLSERKPEFDRQGEWLINVNSVIDGLDRSMERIRTRREG